MKQVTKALSIAHTTKNFGFCNCHLQLKFSYMWHMQLQIHVAT
jgi:hypothetical protein